MKSCPKCRRAAELDARFCSGCGHQFSTKFSTPKGPVCPKCNTPAPGTHCPLCGHLMSAPTPPPVVPPPTPPPPPAPAPDQVARARQPAAVLNDPKYQVNTGFGVGCPQCGSQNLMLVGKAGSGLGYFGSLSWVVVASVAENWIQKHQRQPAQCNYCNATFELAHT